MTSQKLNKNLKTTYGILMNVPFTSEIRACVSWPFTQGTTKNYISIKTAQRSFYFRFIKENYHQTNFTFNQSKWKTDQNKLGYAVPTKGKRSESSVAWNLLKVSLPCEFKIMPGYNVAAVTHYLWELLTSKTAQWTLQNASVQKKGLLAWVNSGDTLERERL